MRQSAFDRWLTTDPENQPGPPEDELVPDDMPDPCPTCDWVGTHDPDCPERLPSMDPEATWSIVSATDRPLAERAEAALNLLVWYAGNGEIVMGNPGNAASIRTRVGVCEDVLSQALDAAD